MITIQSYTFTIATKIYPLPSLKHSCRIPSPVTLFSQSNNTRNKRILVLTDANEWITNKCSECTIRHLPANPLVHIRQKEKKYSRDHTRKVASANKPSRGSILRLKQFISGSQTKSLVSCTCNPSQRYFRAISKQGNQLLTCSKRVSILSLARRQTLDGGGDKYIRSTKNYFSNACRKTANFCLSVFKLWFKIASLNLHP